jgi:hypothetical protein
MRKFTVSAEAIEVNRYDFEVDAKTREEAIEKVNTYLNTHDPYPYQHEPVEGVRCVDREAGMNTLEVRKAY